MRSGRYRTVRRCRWAPLQDCALGEGGESRGHEQHRQRVLGNLRRHCPAALKLRTTACTSGPLQLVEHAVRQDKMAVTRLQYTLRVVDDLRQLLLRLLAVPSAQ